MIELPGDSRRVTIDGINTHYVEAGAGRPLLLFHGLGASVATWRDNIGPLARSFRVVAVDLPGHGDSEKPNIDYHPAAMVRFIASFAEATGLDRPAVIGNLRDEYVLTDRLESLPIPTMVVWGANDRIFPVSQAYHSSASSPRTTLHVFDDCGHWPHMEKADAFNAAVVNFLSP